MKNHNVPESWAHDHNPQSYGSMAIKKGKAPIEQRVAKIVQGNDPRHQDQRKSDHRYRWVISRDRTSGYLKSRRVKTPDR
jgi:hypothetical protein